VWATNSVAIARMILDKESLFLRLVISHAALLLLLILLILMQAPLWILICVLLLCSTVIVWRIYSGLRRQLDLISSVANQIKTGDYSRRIPDLELDEMEHVGKDLNAMLGKLDRTIHHLSVHREELRLVLSTIDDVLWSQNLEGRFELVNSAFQELFAAYNPGMEQCYWEVIREPQLLALIKDSEGSPERIMTELQLGEHFYLLSGMTNLSARRRVFILQNIDGIRQAEQMKRDFVVNLAHELRTPLTAIKGFTEAMQENCLAENSRYLKIIQNHTERLIHLIIDLEQLIRLERTAEIEKQEISLQTFFANLKMILGPEVEEKGLAFEIELDKRLPRLSCDPFKLEQVFINLVQNSLRYTDTGSITIRSKVSDHLITFEVTDTGKGIEARHLSRIFERFYVADSARNRSRSGTGLGLAIVKHIVLLHNGSIEVNSEPGKGTSFYIHLPTEQLQGSW